uniref:uncharacterized protein LOC122607184 n=1 Tax=Erigeron canadensis TaxID=72917 RepID=UPI001CB88E84|nr:uncharacterized protein LOC122607184 [Erigeron canadensis]
MPGGRTAHSRFKIPLNLENNSMCNIKQQSGTPTAQLLRQAKLIIWDEASMAKRQAVEALDRTLQDITTVSLPFGGKVMVLGDPWFSHFLLRVGDGNEEVSEGNFIRIPDDMAIPYSDAAKSKEELIEKIFPNLQINRGSPDYVTSQAILSTKNNYVDDINNQLIEKFWGEEKVYYSFDEAEDDKNNFYPIEFLNTLTVSGLPPYCLRLKVGCPIILIRNIDPSNGLCNGTRLVCRGFQPNVIDGEVAVGEHSG